MPSRVVMSPLLSPLGQTGTASRECALAASVAAGPPSGATSIPPANPIGPTVAGARLVHPPAAAGQSATPTGADSPSHPKEGTVRSLDE